MAKNKKAQARDLPAHTQIKQLADGAFFQDCYQIPVAPDAPSALALYLLFVRRTPTWVSRLMSLRNRITSLLGLKDLGHLQAVGTKSADQYVIGDRVGIFSLTYLSDHEIILSDADKHLDVHVSICKLSAAGQHCMAVSTVVHVHNWLGKIYMFFITPIHKMIVPAMLALE